MDLTKYENQICQIELTNHKSINGYTDTSYYDDYSTSRSTSAYIFKLYNGPII